MDINIPPVIFFGTGPVAAKSLELLAKNFKIEAVITKPIPAHHRLNAPVLDLANKLSLKVLTVENKKDLNTLLKSNPVKSKLAVLIDFGIIISQEVINYFPLGIINSHFSVLPDLRGADPITFAILSGQTQTGVSLMKVVKAMDEGPLISYRIYDLPKDITTPKLTEELILVSDSLLKQYIPLIYSGQTEDLSQSTTGKKVSYSHRLNKQDGMLDWSKPAIELEREIRAYLGWPGSRTTIADKEVIITKAHVTSGDGNVGDKILTKKTLEIQTADQRLALDKIKPAGKQEMNIESFLAGYSDKIK